MIDNERCLSFVRSIYVIVYIVDMFVSWYTYLQNFHRQIVVDVAGRDFYQS